MKPMVRNGFIVVAVLAFACISASAMADDDQPNLAPPQSNDVLSGVTPPPTPPPRPDPVSTPNPPQGTSVSPTINPPGAKVTVPTDVLKK